MQEKPSGTLRQKLLAFVGLLILLSLVGSSVSLYRITEVNRTLDSINRVSVPLGRLVTQVGTDADVFLRELDRSLGYSHWKDQHWRAHPLPQWIDGILESELNQVSLLLSSKEEWADPATEEHWRAWSARTLQHFNEIRTETNELYTALDKGDQTKAEQILPHWSASVEEWHRELLWGANQYDHALRQSFAIAEGRVTELRTGLEMALVIVVCLSLLLLWLAERALRPLADLTRLARDIARRGLRKGDKSMLPDLSLGRKDEVNQLAREFHRMATALLEREKMVETQTHRLEHQNQLLTAMGGLNENILNSIESILLVTNLEGEITQANPVALRLLGQTLEQLKASKATDYVMLASILREFSWKAAGSEGSTFEARKIEPALIGERVFGGRIMPLKQAHGELSGFIVVLDDLTEELSIEERLRQAENLAAIGRLSAQVAHEVRNPLHSIGLEAEMAQEAAAKLGNPMLKQSLQSILASVDRLEKITENYLKLSRLSTGIKRRFDLGDVLESVLATYAPLCEAQQIHVDWNRQEQAELLVFGDPELLEQVLGNLMRNSIQAINPADGKIHWSLGAHSGNSQVWIRIEDNGPGIAPSYLSKLFTPFLTTRAQGTGLGLSFAKKVVEDHGGGLTYRKSSVLGGACFEVRLPNGLENSTDRGGEHYAENSISG